MARQEGKSNGIAMEILIVCLTKGLSVNYHGLQIVIKIFIIIDCLTIFVNIKQMFVFLFLLFVLILKIKNIK